MRAGKPERMVGAGLKRGKRSFGVVLAFVATLATLLLALGGCGVGGAVTLPQATATIPLPTPTPTIPAIPAPNLLVPGGKGEAFLQNATTGQVYLQVNADHQMAMASTTKIMTAVVALSYGKLDQQITIGADATPSAVNAACQQCGPSVAGLVKGDTLTLDELLYGLLLPSGDDAAVAIADGIAGSQEHFVALMNLEATFLGLRDTHYVNVHGLDADGHYTTAHDLALLTASAMSFPEFAKIVGTAKHTYKGYTWINTNELLPGERNEYNGAMGIKTGSTGQAGYCLVFEAQRSEGTLVGVILGEKNENDRFTDAKKLLDWGFQIEQKQQGG